MEFGRSASISAASQRRPGPRQLAGQGELAVALDRPAYVGEGVAAEPLEVGDLGAGALGVDVEELLGELGLHRDHGQRVAEDVVQVAGEPVALVVDARAGRSPRWARTRSRLRAITARTPHIANDAAQIREGRPTCCPSRGHRARGISSARQHGRAASATPGRRKSMPRTAM